MERLVVLLLPTFLVVELLQIWLGYVGVEHDLGWIAATIAIAAVFLLVIMLPITIGSYFGAVDVVGWPWWAGILIALPGLLFVVPGMVMAALEPILRR